PHRKTNPNDNPRQTHKSFSEICGKMNLKGLVDKGLFIIEKIWCFFQHILLTLRVMSAMPAPE
ncbi:MAG: hypothetical protein K2K45_07175, partial [Muribaculaceae bacterium]|nr:hypothetical protein [Muribaculaceae bacterium]